MNEHARELFHHGIANQRWYVRNGPPYPLSKKLHNRVTSGKQDKNIDRENNSLTGTTTGYGGYYMSKGHRTDYHTGIETSRHFKVVKYVDGEPTDETIDKVVSDQDFMRSIRTLSNHGKISGETDLKSTNPLLKISEREQYDDPEYSFPGEVLRGSSNNCLKCSSVLALRAKGYDVTAGLAPEGMLSSSTEKYWDGARQYKENSVENIEKRMISFGNKGMGTLGIRRQDGNGHSMFFQNERQSDGTWKPIVYDGQSGERVGSVLEAISQECHDFSNFCSIVRLDDATPNFKNMAMDSVFVPRKGAYGLSSPSKRFSTQKSVYWDF